MQNYYGELDQYFAVTSQNSLLSLQLLDEINIEESTPLEQPQLQQGQENEVNHTHLDEVQQQTQSQLARLRRDEQDIKISEQMPQKQKQNTQIISNSQTNSRVIFKPTTTSEQKSSNSNFLKVQRVLSMTDQNNSDILRNLDHSNISRNTIKKGCESTREITLDSTPQEEIGILRQLKQQAFANLNTSQQTQQIKYNFEVLFQKVYGIIEQIQQRNQKSKMLKSLTIPRKELSLTTKVLELSVGKEKEKFKKEFYTNIQTDYDYDKESCDQNLKENVMRTEGNWSEHTPVSSMSKIRKGNLLSLSKQFPQPITPLNFNLNSARSNRSSRSKGLTLVSVQKKKPEIQIKKPVKISLIQKKIVMAPKQRKQVSKVQKIQKKISSVFNPNSFFNSRRVSNSRVF